MIYKGIIEKLKDKKLFAVLIDPEKHTLPSIDALIPHLDPEIVDIILLGGSLVSKPIEPLLDRIRMQSPIPIILFPGSIYQLSSKADAVLLLSLISGRNPALLIGDHVKAAPIIKRLGIETLSTGYILIGDGKVSSVEYMSNTIPIPSQKIDIAVATALAGEYLGHQFIYLEHGSGATHPMEVKIVEAVKREITVPLIVGGGIHHPAEAGRLFNAGADIIVVGTRIEEDPGFIREMGKMK